MREPNRRGHAVRVPYLGPPGPPFVPVVGGLYRVMSLLYSSSDPAPARPVVVVEVPARSTPTARIRVVTRSSHAVEGVAHPADLALELDRNGVFSTLGLVLASSWRSGAVLHLGDLPEPYLSRVIEWSS